jgi:serine/threonine protein kinase
MDDFQRKIVSEEGCFASTFERKYYRKGDIFVKRSLRESEYHTGYRGLHIPKLGIERLRNEAASLQFVQESTDIPVPRLYHHFEHDGAYYVAMEYVEGVSMADLSENQKEVVAREIEVHLSTMHNIKSNKIGGPSGIIIPPYRIMGKTEDKMPNPPTEDHQYVFCHMDLSQHNVIVDPKTLKIKAIIDLEYSGFWPEQFDLPFYTRLGPSVARKGEIDDTLELLEFLKSGSSAICVKIQ